jgi:predicted Zn-dependent protease
MSDIENRVRESPAVNRKDSNAFWYVRAKLRVIQARDGRAQEAAVGQLQQEARQLSGVAQSAAWYGLAYAAWQKQNEAQARAALQSAQENGLNSPEISSLSVMLALKQGDGNAALAQAQTAWARWPSSQGVALALVGALQSLGRDKESIDFLAQRIKQWPDLPRLYQLQAQGYERLGQAVEARRAMAVYYEKTGALPTAVEQLQQARGLSKDFYVQSELDVSIRTLKERLKSDRALLERFKS